MLWIPFLWHKKFTLQRGTRALDTCLLFPFSNFSHNPGNDFAGFLVAIVRVEFGTHSRQNVVRPFSGLGFPDELRFAEAASAPYRFPVLNLFKNLKSSAMFAHDNSFPRAGTDCYPCGNSLHQYPVLSIVDEKSA